MSLYFKKDDILVLIDLSVFRNNDYGDMVADHYDFKQGDRFKVLSTDRNSAVEVIHERTGKMIDLSDIREEIVGVFIDEDFQTGAVTVLSPEEAGFTTPTPVLWWRGTGQPQYARDLIREKGIIYQQNKEKQDK
jgi:hypothetical protein